MYEPIKPVKTRVENAHCANPACKKTIAKGEVSYVRKWTDNLQYFSARFCSEECAEAR